jgi:DNA primase
MPFISKKTIDEIQDRLDPAGVIGEYVRLEQRGGNYWGLCPFHNEKTPSFSVNAERKAYYCFGCQTGGGIINFVMKVEKITFPEAVTLLAKKLSIPVEYEDSGGLVRNGGDDAQKKDDLVELYRRVAGSFHRILLDTAEGESAKKYLFERGVNAEMIERFRLGWAPPDRYWLHKFLCDKGYSAEFLAQSGLFSRNYPKSAFFSGRLMFPINDRQGRTVAFGGRILDGDGPKYINSQESAIYRKRETLFALDIALNGIRRTNEATLCEGYMDVIALHQAGVTNAVAPLGTSFTEDQARLLHRWAEKINLLFDSDAAGIEAAEKAILICRKTAVSCGIIKINQTDDKIFKDPADILKNMGCDVLSMCVKNVVMDVDYLADKSKNVFLTGQDGTFGIAKALAFLVPFFFSIESESEKTAFAQKVAVILGVEPDAVLHDLKSGREKQPAARNFPAENSAKRTIAMNDELYLLTAVAVNCETFPDLFIILRKKLPNEEIEDKDARNIYLALEECLRQGSLFLDALLSSIEDEALKIFLAQKSAGGEFSGRVEQIVSDGIHRIKIKRLEGRSRKLDTEIRLAKNLGHDTGDLLLEKQFIIDELYALKES